MSIAQRLTETDVEEVFGVLHGHQPHPDHLKFQIVPIGPHGLRLSPPPIEFENGLYVLLRPEKKDKPKPKVPPHLLSLVVKSTPDQSCPWSLSGPQFPQPCKFQQRYCYPKGNPMYSSQKGGALWTMYDSNGQEDLSYRLLHVYFSPKRAGIRSATPSPARRRRRVSTPNSAASTPSSRSKSSPAGTPVLVPNVVPTSPWPPRHQNRHHHHHHGSALPHRPYWQAQQPQQHHQNSRPHYPMVPATLVHTTPPPPMRPATGAKHYLTPPPPPPGYNKRHKADIPTPPPTRSMMMTTAATPVAGNHESGNRAGTDVYMDSAVLAAAKMPALQEEAEDDWLTLGEAALLDTPELSLLDHDDEMALRAKLSFELLPFSTIEDSKMDDLLMSDASPTTSLQKRLEVMHHHLMEWIQQRPKDKQAALRELVCQWAQRLQSELQELKESDGDEKEAAAAKGTTDDEEATGNDEDKKLSPPASETTDPTTTPTTTVKMESV